MYVSELIAPGTVNTMPEKTLKAVRRPRRAAATPVQKAYDDAARRHDRPSPTPASTYDDVFEVLEDEGVQKFEDSWDELTDVA